MDMDLELTQVFDEEKVNDDNQNDLQVGILRVGTTEHSIPKGFTRIGRNPAVCKIFLDDLTVSKVHAEIQAGYETAFISDVRSANGTKIKDVKLKPFFYYTINDGDAIYFGNVKAIFKTNKSTLSSNTTLPETPIPSRRFNETDTPRLGNTSDVLFNNTSVYQSDDSVIPGTQQKSKISSIFQEPSAPADRRRISNRISAILASPFDKSNRETKLQDDVDFTDLHDMETQEFMPSESRETNKSKQNDRATKSQDEIENADFHEMGDKNEYEPKKNKQLFDDNNIYDAETQILSPSTQKKKSKYEKKMSGNETINSTACSSKSYNSSSNFSRLLRVSGTPSPSSSPNNLDENSEFNQSQNLLEMCELPLLELEKKSNASGKSDESSNRKNSSKSDVSTSHENSGAKSSMENIVNNKKSDCLSHVIAESEDDSATDDDLDIEIGKTISPNKKLGNLGKPSEIIEDDSATDDEGHFEKLAALSPPKDQGKLSLKMSTKIAENRKAEENIIDAKTQKINEKKGKIGEEKLHEKTTNVENTEDNIFDAETQLIDADNSVENAAKIDRGNSDDSEIRAHKKGGKTLRMELKLREVGENIFEAATQRMEDENLAESVAKKCGKSLARNSDVENRQMEGQISKVSGEKKGREKDEDSDDGTNIFEAATQIIRADNSREKRVKKNRKSEKICVTKENIFDAETQQMEVEIGEIFKANKHRENPENSEIDANIFDAATQRMENDISEPVKHKKRRDLSKNINDDADIDLLPTQVLDVPTSTPVSRSRNSKDRIMKKKLCSKMEKNSAAKEIIKDWEEIIDESSTEDSPVGSPTLGSKIAINIEDNRAEVNLTSFSRSPKSKGRKRKKSPRLETKKGSERSGIVENLEDSIGKKKDDRSADNNSSLGEEIMEKEKKTKSVNLDETLMRNLGIILDEEANNQELSADQSTELMTQNLVDILRPTQSFEENESRDSEKNNVDDDNNRGKLNIRKKNKEKVGSPSTLGFFEGHAVNSSVWSDRNSPKAATSTTTEDKREDDEKNVEKSGATELSEWLDPDSIFYGLPEVRISGTLSNPGSPCSSTTSNRDDFVAPKSSKAENPSKSDEKMALSSTANLTNVKTDQVEKSEELDSPVVKKKLKIARKRIAKKIIEDEDEDSDEESFAYNELKKMADQLLASGSVNLTKLAKTDNFLGFEAEEVEKISTTGRILRHERKNLSSINYDEDYRRGSRKLAKPSSSLTVSDSNIKDDAEETKISNESETSSSGAKRTTKRASKATKTRSKSAITNKSGKESQEIEAILASKPTENIAISTKRPYVKVQLTRLDDNDINQRSNDREKIEEPKNNRKRRATMYAKDLTPTASPASAKSRRTISEGLENQTVTKEQHKILLTGLKEEHSKLAKKLGGLVVSEPSKATVLITDKVRRTYKFLCAVARGLRVVSLNWLLESQKASRFLDCDDFMLKDPAAEKLYDFQLEKSLQTARTKKFLQGYTIIITPKVNQPEISELKDMIEASGGKALTRAPGVRSWNAKTVIVSREEDSTAIKALLSKCPKTVKVTVQSVEFILSGILRQEVNLVEHKLNIP